MPPDFASQSPMLAQHQPALQTNHNGLHVCQSALANFAKQLQKPVAETRRAGCSRKWCRDNSLMANCLPWSIDRKNGDSDKE